MLKKLSATVLAFSLILGVNSVQVRASLPPSGGSPFMFAPPSNPQEEEVFGFNVTTSQTRATGYSRFVEECRRQIFVPLNELLCKFVQKHVCRVAINDSAAQNWIFRNKPKVRDILARIGAVLGEADVLFSLMDVLFSLPDMHDVIYERIKRLNETIEEINKDLDKIQSKSPQIKDLKDCCLCELPDVKSLEKRIMFITQFLI